MFVSILLAFDQVKQHLRSDNMSMLSFVLQFLSWKSQIISVGNLCIDTKKHRRAQTIGHRDGLGCHHIIIQQRFRTSLNFVTFPQS